MVRKIFTLVALAFCSASAYALDNDKFMALLKKQPANYQEVASVVGDVEFNPYKKINDVSVYELAKRYKNTAMIMAIEMKMAGRSDLSLKEEGLYEKLLENPHFDVSNLNLLIALNDVEGARNYIVQTFGSEFQLNNEDVNGNTPLKTVMLTSDMRGRHEMLSLLGEYGVELDMQNIGEHGDTAILHACRHDLPLDIFTLMGLGADWLEKSKSGQDILEVSKNTLICKEIMNKLISHSDGKNR